MPENFAESGKTLSPGDKKSRAIDYLQSVIQNISAVKLSEYSDVDDVKVLPVQKPYASIFGHWLTVILISSRKLKISFKAHYLSKNAIALLAKKRRSAKEDVSMAMAFDFIKEYCNLTGGAVKACLGKENSLTGLSLPLLTRGFDEVLFMDRIRQSNKLKYRDVWRLETSFAHLICSSEILVTEWDVLENIVDPSTQADGGELEFL